MTAIQPGTRVLIDNREFGTVLRTRQPYPIAGYHAVRFDDGGSMAIHKDRFVVRPKLKVGDDVLWLDQMDAPVPATIRKAPDKQLPQHWVIAFANGYRLGVHERFLVPR